jgi:hypothetical protein
MLFAGHDSTPRQVQQDEVRNQLRPGTSMLVLRVADVRRADEIRRRLAAEHAGGKVLRSNPDESTERALSAGSAPT